MKNRKQGFTLAEVLITLSIIGIVAAVTLPVMMSSYQYSSIGVKLSKFLATTENSARAYVAQSGENLTTEDVQDFVNDSFLIKKVSPANTDSPLLYTIASGNLQSLPDLKTQSGTIATLKDGTTIVINTVAKEEFSTHKGVVDSHKVGLPVFNINFDPQVQGIPSTVQKNFNFIVTELGYVFPNDDDTCLWDIYQNDFHTKAKLFKEGTSCNTSNTKKEDEDIQVS